MKFSNTVKYALPAAILGCLTLGLASVPAAAATNTTTFMVTATVVANCTITPTGGVAFGSYTGTAKTASTTLTINCTNTTPYSVGLNPGATSGATVTTRQMKGALPATTTTLSYGLTTDSAGAKNWTDIGGSNVATGTGTSSTQTINVYGQLAAGQAVAPDSYSDTITATISY
jgi:spore coat protein U-like protein